MLYLTTQYQLLMIDPKLAIMTIHDVNPSHSEKILKTSDELDKLKIKYNIGIVPYYRKKI
jgi:hypothetical protein